jgi:hypothetical protein
MDRGRPKKRSDSIKSTATKNNEQKAFETLPQGIKASDALSKLSAQDIESLKRQALGQAAQFEVLNAKDVNDLSRVSFSRTSTRAHGFLLTIYRNFVLLTNAVIICAVPTSLSAPAAAIFMNASAHICDRRVSHVSRMMRSSNRKKHSQNWTLRSTTGCPSSNWPKTDALGSGKSYLSMSPQLSLCRRQPAAAN